MRLGGIFPFMPQQCRGDHTQRGLSPTTREISAGWIGGLKTGATEIRVGEVGAGETLAAQVDSRLLSIPSNPWDLCLCLGIVRCQHGIGGRLSFVRLGVIQGIVQAAAFLAGEGGSDDEFGGDHEVAQFDEVVGDPEVAVVFGDFALQQVDAALGPLQTLGAAHDTDVIPHEAPQFVPVVGDDDLFVGIGDPAFVPWAKRDGGGEGFDGLPDMVGSGFGEDETFQEGVAGHAVGAVEPGG